MTPVDFAMLCDALEKAPAELASQSTLRIIEESRAAYLWHAAESSAGCERIDVAARLRRLLADLRPVVDLTHALANEELPHTRRGK